LTYYGPSTIPTNPSDTSPGLLALAAGFCRARGLGAFVCGAARKPLLDARRGPLRLSGAGHDWIRFYERPADEIRGLMSDYQEIGSDVETDHSVFLVVPPQPAAAPAATNSDFDALARAADAAGFDARTFSRDGVALLGGYTLDEATRARALVSRGADINLDALVPQSS